MRQIEAPSESSELAYDENSWRIQDIPNWGNTWVQEEEFADLSPSRFFREYVSRWRPVVIRGASREWAAHTKWSDDSYLLERWGKADVTIFTAPNPQGFHPRSHEARGRAQHAATLAELIRSDGKNESVKAHFLGTGGLLDSMAEDIQDDWLYESTLPPIYYPKRRVFIHRGGISLWHRHPVDDHLTFQVRGSKDFALLDPLQSETLASINRNELYSFDIDHAKYPRWRSIRPLCARLNAGDAIYLPPLWWHTVVPVDQRLGITLASTWGSSRQAILRNGIPKLFFDGSRGSLRNRVALLFYTLTGAKKFLFPRFLL
jgi:hypothetical protein